MSKKRIYDVSLTIEPDMLVWPGNPPVAVDTIKSIADGAPARVLLREIK